MHAAAQAKCLIAGRRPSLLLAQSEEATQTRIVGAQCVQLAGELLDSANDQYSLNIRYLEPRMSSTASIMA